MSAKPPAEHHLEFLILKGGRTGSPKCTHVKMPHGWKSHVESHLCHVVRKPVFGTLILSEGKKKYIFASVENRHIGSLVSLPFRQRTTRAQTQTVGLDRLVVVPVVLRMK